VDKSEKRRIYTPDAYVEFTDGKKILVEVKLESEVYQYKEKYKERWDAARKWAEENDAIFYVLTERHIRTPRFFNIWFILGASKCIQNADYMKSLNLLIPNEGIGYNILCQVLSRTLGIAIGKSAQVLCYAIYHGLVFVDSFSTEPLARSTIIRKNPDSSNIPFIPLWKEIIDVMDVQLAGIDDQQGVETQLKSLSPDLDIGSKDESIANRREEMVLAWLHQPFVKRTSVWRQAFCNEWQVSESKIYRLVSRYNTDGKNGLFPRHKGRDTLFSEDVQNLIEAARIQYLKPNMTLSKAYKKLVGDCESIKVKPPKFSTLKKYIYQNSTVIEFAGKKGCRYVHDHFTPALKSYQGGVIPMHVIQMDNTPIDIFPVDGDEREPLPTPHLTAAIDCYTGLITGFNVSYFAPSARSALEVLVQTILPKNEYTTVYQTETGWNVDGFPVVILLDNGKDFTSNMFRDFCKKYDIIVEYVPLRKGQFKAYIEQWFNILKNAMRQETIPGMRPTLRERIINPDLKPEKRAVLTLQEIEAWLHKWTIDEYHFTNHYDDKVKAPQLKNDEVREGQTELIFPCPREPPIKRREIDDLYLSVLEKDERTLRKDGIHVGNLKYNNKELGHLFKTIGTKKVPILKDSRDIRYIWVIDEDGRRTIKVGLGSGWAAALLMTYGERPIHKSAWQENVRQIRKSRKTEITAFSYQKAMSYQKRLEIVDTSRKTQKHVRKEKEKAYETMRKGINHKISNPPSEEMKGGVNPGIIDSCTSECSEHEVVKSEERASDIYETYKPRLLSTSRYPKKRLPGE
jgi:transposase